MRRIGRTVFLGLAGVSLLLWVATAGLWVRSYLYPDSVRHPLSIGGGWTRTTVGVFVGQDDASIRMHA